MQQKKKTSDKALLHASESHAQKHNAWMSPSDQSVGLLLDLIFSCF